MYLPKLPSYSDIVRRFEERENYVLKDSIANRDASILLPYDIVTENSIMLFPESLTGVTVECNGGTSVVEVADNELHFTAGTVWDIQLTNGYFIPLPSTGVVLNGTDSNNRVWGCEFDEMFGPEEFPIYVPPINL